MKKGYIRLMIIVLIQTVLPIIGLFLITPLVMSQSSLLNRWQTFFSQEQTVFLSMHIVFYIALVGLWPKLIAVLKSEETTCQQIQLAMQVRWYLVAMFVISDIIINIGVR